MTFVGIRMSNHLVGFTLLLVLGMAISGSPAYGQGTSTFENVTISNFLHQVGGSETNYIMGRFGVGTATPESDMHVAGDLTVDGAMAVPRQGDIAMGGYTNGAPSSGVQVGSSRFMASYIHGMALQYSSTTLLIIQPGEGICSGSYFALLSNYNYSVTSMASALDFHYVYLDDEASTYPSDLVFYDSKTEPTKDDSQHGWYLGNDRVVGVIGSDNGATTIEKFVCTAVGVPQRYIWIDDEPNDHVLANNLNPSGSWQAPTTESAGHVPVNATEILLMGKEKDANAKYKLQLTRYEATIGSPSTADWCGDWVICDWVGGEQYHKGWITLGASRNIRLWAENDDDNATQIVVHGYGIQR